MIKRKKYRAIAPNGYTCDENGRWHRDSDNLYPKLKWPKVTKINLEHKKG